MGFLPRLEKVHTEVESMIKAEAIKMALSEGEGDEACLAALSQEARLTALDEMCDTYF